LPEEVCVVSPRRPRTYSNYNAIAVQGLGAGAITSSVQIVISDLVTLRERGIFTGLLALCVTLSLFLVPGNMLTLRSPWVVGGGVGPVIGGALAQNGKWYALVCDLSLADPSQSVLCSRRWFFCMWDFDW